MVDFQVDILREELRKVKRILILQIFRRKTGVKMTDANCRFTVTSHVFIFKMCNHISLLAAVICWSVQILFILSVSK